ncbi:4Fe-4S binding protein [Candidatus Woesearchaeota archaeon]|nr:4Fe-4S binding protein [Candidatus Woesearchaeota archaeon]
MADDTSRLKKYSEIPIGGIIEKAGNSEEYLTGGWRAMRPVHIPEKCINCMICWVVCPDCCVKGKDGNFSHFDYSHCKGCGLCAANCPTKAIVMKPESEFKD